MNRGRSLTHWLLAGLIFLAAAGIAGPRPTVSATLAAPPVTLGNKEFIELRNRMVDDEIVAAGVKDKRVVDAMRNTPRHEFVAASERPNAYFDMALPIGEGQTISPPFIVAYMTEQLQPQPLDKVLEIGTGSGYQAAVLSPLVKEVYSIEIVKPLGERAARALKRLKYANVYTKVGDGYQGWPEHAPFDKIIVTCSPEKVPEALVKQLKDGGRMVVPVGERYQQTLYLFRKEDGKLISEELLPTLFVPMTGRAEDAREVLPDPEHPKVNNGGFEEVTGESELPTGWHYVRQMQLVSGADAAEGKRYVKFTNSHAGRGSQALQGMAVDGRKIGELNVSVQIRGVNIRPGRREKELPTVGFTFYDSRRATAGETWLGPWRGSFDWREVVEKIKVPATAREAIIRIGLGGATGEISFDDLSIEAVSRAK